MKKIWLVIYGELFYMFFKKEDAMRASNYLRLLWVPAEVRELEVFESYEEFTKYMKEKLESLYGPLKGGDVNEESI